MGPEEIFERFAADFESAVKDDDWSRLGQYLAKDVTYLNVGGPDPKSEGRDAVIAFLKDDVSRNDRKFDTRTLTALIPPAVMDNRLTRRWRCTYTFAGAPDLVVEGEARYLFEGDLIKAIEEEPTAASMRSIKDWMMKYGDRLEDQRSSTGLKIDYIELPAADFDAVESFYNATFGWSFTDYGEAYRAFTDGNLDGGFFKSELRSSTTNGAALVVLFAGDLEATLSAVLANGGSLCKEIFSFPGGRRFHFLDPHGNELAVWSDR